MSLRYRLFLWVSGLFIVISLCSYVLENFVTRRELKKAQHNLREEILAISEQHRIDIQNYLATSIAEDEVKVDAILNNISSFSPEAIHFAPTVMNDQKGTWRNVSDLLLEYKWIDFIQNTSEGKATATLLLEPNGMNCVYRIPIDEDLCWVYHLDHSEGAITPSLGVRVPFTLSMQDKVEGAEKIPNAYLLFDVKGMKESSQDATQPIFKGDEGEKVESIPVKWVEGVELNLQLFIKAFQRGRDSLLSNQIHPPQYTTDVLKTKMEEAASHQDGKLNAIPEETLLSSVTNEKFTRKRFEEMGLRYTQINVIWSLIAFFDSGVFGNDLFSFPSPTSATIFSGSKSMGVGIDVHEVFFPKKVFDDSVYYSRNIPKNPHSNLATSLAVIPSPISTHVFLGNTAQFVNNNRVGYLTLGIDADFILQKLVLALRQPAILVHGGKPLNAYSETGEKLELGSAVLIPFAEIINKNSGIISWKDENYYFIRVQPFPDVDLHFFLFNLESKEFALLHDLEKGSQRVVDTIRLNIHLSGLVALIIAIVILHNISRNITKPIVQLAKVTKDVGQGDLEQVRRSIPVQKHKDEIAVLCQSFDEMIRGLQEKEKVQGILNKVVSREIAEEILKGGVHLGGEEKRVTVLFADIREFTHMTQNMPPQEVITLLNQCMTKISQVIDKNNGVIDKFVGDEAMALFGAPVTHSEDAFNAIKSAVEILQAIKEWNQQREANHEPAVELGIGIHTGPMLVGNMGAENRLNYTVIGSNVNLAFRLCSSAKKMEILITKDTLDEPFIKDRIVFEPVPAMQFKGFDQPIDIYRVLRIKK